jgi:hypothetical protein
MIHSIPKVQEVFRAAMSLHQDRRMAVEDTAIFLGLPVESVEEALRTDD